MKKKNPDGNKGTVYSTAHGRICPACEQPVARCSCREEEEPGDWDGIVRVSRQAKGRKGKTVTVITGLPLASAEMKDLAGQLKKKCGSGGTVSGRAIEIQGDFHVLVPDLLEERGWTVKVSGG